jgi:succinate dehydrogenase/fumarate reductase flavoprotein subunit
MPADEDVDLLVIGGGVAGLTAALVAAIEGLNVRVCEKTTQLGGTAATSAGTVWVPGSRQSERAGLADPVVRAQHYLAAEIDTDSGAELRDAYLASGARVLAYLAQHSCVSFVPAARHPDYHDQHAGAAIGGRALVARPFDGRQLGADFALVRPPMRHMMVLGGMSVSKDDIAPLLRPFASWRALRHVLALLGRHARDRLRHPRGTRLVMGNALIARLLHSLRERGVAPLMGVTVRELQQDAGGTVGGATLVQAGRAWRVRARLGVVLACGGFGHAPDWRQRLLPEAAQPHSLMFEGNTGDGLRLAQAVGAAVDEADHRTPAFWTPVSVLQRDGGPPQRFPHFALDRAKPGLLAVDARGRRFANEADSYHDFVLAMLGAGAVPAHLICDAAFLRRYGLGLVRPGAWRLGPFVRAGYLKTAPTLAALAAQLGIDPDALQATVARHNGFASTGVDLDFGKGTSELNRFNGDERHRPNPCIGAIGRAPFFSVTVWPGDAGTSVGLRTDADARVLGRDGEPIAGLYACGADMASIMRGRYPGPGVTLGPAMVFAWRAVMRAKAPR